MSGRVWAQIIGEGRRDRRNWQEAELLTDLCEQQMGIHVGIRTCSQMCLTRSECSKRGSNATATLPPYASQTAMVSSNT
jgi:hypothetical protein